MARDADRACDAERRGPCRNPRVLHTRRRQPARCHRDTDRTRGGGNDRRRRRDGRFVADREVDHRGDRRGRRGGRHPERHLAAACEVHDDDGWLGNAAVSTSEAGGALLVSPLALLAPLAALALVVGSAAGIRFMRRVFLTTPAEPTTSEPPAAGATGLEGRFRAPTPRLRILASFRTPRVRTPASESGVRLDVVDHLQAALPDHGERDIENDRRPT